jgi:hypothetical protein
MLLCPHVEKVYVHPAVAVNGNKITPLEYEGVYCNVDVGVIGNVTVWGVHNCAETSTVKNSEMIIRKINLI